MQITFNNTKVMDLNIVIYKRYLYIIASLNFTFKKIRARISYGRNSKETNCSHMNISEFPHKSAFSKMIFNSGM